MDGSLSKMSEDYVRHFEEQFSEHGESFKTIGFSTQSQRKRFEILSGIGDLGGKDILDVGCGFGDFYIYLIRNFPICNYIGIDINLDMINIAKERNPNISFYHNDILDFGFETLIDYSLASGIFFLPNSNWEKRFIAICRKLLKLSKIGVGINLLSIFSPNCDKNKENYYVEPWKVLKLVMEILCKKAILRHDYRVNDFTIYMYKENG